MKKALKIISYIIPLLVVLTLGFVGICYFDELRTLISVKPVEGTNLYTMEYFSDYHFDDFLKTGAKSDKEYYEYINRIIDNIKLSYDELHGETNAIIFTGKIGENSNIIRKIIVEKLSKIINVKLDDKENNELNSESNPKNGVITTHESQIPIFVIPNYEELLMLEELEKEIQNNAIKKLIYKKD